MRRAVMLFGVVLLVGCSQDAREVPTMNSQPILKVAVMKDGRVLVDGTESSLENLGRMMSDLSTRKGVVWYYREAGDGEPHPHAMEVMSLLVANRLPVSLSSAPDYSNVVMPDGSVRPR